MLDTTDVIIGYGTKPQEGQLIAAGAEKVFFHPDQLQTVMDLKGISLRPMDVLLMVQPKLMTQADMMELAQECAFNVSFQVVGNAPVKPSTVADFRAFRQQKAVGVSTDLEIQTTGRPSRVAYTEAQVLRIMEWWQAKPLMKLSTLLFKVDGELGLPAGTTGRQWVCDLAIKYVGNAKRETCAEWKKPIITKENEK